MSIQDCRHSYPQVSRWARLLALAVLVVFRFPDAHAQVNRINLVEAQRILEALPEFRAALARRECPGFDLLEPPNSNFFGIQIRGYCQPDSSTGSTTIGNFRVNRATGVVTLWGDGGPGEGRAVVDSGVRAIAASVLRSATSRAITRAEAECVSRSSVATEADRLVGAVSVKLLRIINGNYHIQVEQKSHSPDVVLAWSVIMSEGGDVVRINSGLDEPSTEGRSMLNKILRTRTPASLSSTNAIMVALQAPEIARRIKPGCSSLSAEVGTASNRYVVASDRCVEGSVDAVLASVNVFTGEVTEPGGKPLGNKLSKSMASEFLELARMRIALDREELTKACGITSPPPR